MAWTPWNLGLGQDTTRAEARSGKIRISTINRLHFQLQPVAMTSSGPALAENHHSSSNMNRQIQHQSDLFSARSYLTAYDFRSSLPTSPQPPCRLSSVKGASARKYEHANSLTQASPIPMNTRRIPSTRSTGRPRLGADDRAVLSEVIHGLREPNGLDSA